MSTVNTNAILRSADERVIFRKSGSIIQSKRAAYYTSTYQNTSQGSLYDMPGNLGDGTASISPHFANSKILFTSLIQCGCETTWRGNYFRTYYKIGSGSWTQFEGTSASIMWCNTNGVARTIKSSYLLPSLSTTSTVYFKISHIGHQSGGYLHLNENSTTGSNSGNEGSVASCIFLQEVAQ